MIGEINRHGVSARCVLANVRNCDIVETSSNFSRAITFTIGQIKGIESSFSSQTVD